MKVIQTELSEAIADLAAKVPGARIHLSVHDAPFEIFAADDVKKIRVVRDGMRTWLAGTAEASDYRIDFYSANLPQAEQPQADDADVIPL